MLLILGLVIISLGVGLTAWLLTSASLAPVQRLRQSAETLSASNTNELLPIGPARDEISRLAATLNELITRLRASAVRERQLVSDASHELRTPIAILTTQLQLAASQPASLEQLHADIEGARHNVARLSALVTSLLELSSYEADDRANSSDGGDTTATELQREAQDAVERAAFRAGNSARTNAIEVSFDGIEGSADSSVRFAIRVEDWGRAIDNLCSNSLRALARSGAHGATTDRPRRLEVRMRAHGHAHDSLSLTVSDTGGGLSPGFEPHAFERFTREDESRGIGGGPDGGAGLGLPIVAAIVDKAGGTIALLNHPGLGLDVTITLPAHPPSAQRTVRSQ